MKRKITILGCLFLTAAVILFFVGLKYPFWNPAVGKWSVGYQEAEMIFPELKQEPAGILDYEYVDSILQESGHYIADPFFIKEKDTFYLFVELKGESNADIALFQSTDGKDYFYKDVVLDEPFHLSYPQVFEHLGEFFMLPEASGSNNVLLYKAVNFPEKWIISDTLVKDISLKDPTVLLSGDLNLMIGVDDNMEQLLFTADSLKGSWTKMENFKSRKGNEIRPGGRFFNFDGTWYLPVQNASQGYGTGISLYSLNQKNNNISFEIEKKFFLRPQKNIQWFNRGMHHIDIQRIGEDFYMVYDGDRKKKKKTEFQYKRSLKFAFFDLYNFFTN